MMFTDSSFFIAVALSSDGHHAKAVNALSQIPKPLITSEDVVKETLTIISQRLGKQKCIEFFKRVLATTKILPITSDRFHRGLEIFLRADLQKDISLIDCITATIAAEIGVKTILTFDRHFKTFGITVQP